jgi:hypothetical protein
VTVWEENGTEDAAEMDVDGAEKPDVGGEYMHVGKRRRESMAHMNHLD